MEIIKKGNYVLCSRISEGSHGIVFKIRYNKGTKKLYYAMKVPKSDNVHREYLNNEISILRNIEHPNIVKLVDYEIDNYLILELFKTNCFYLKNPSLSLLKMIALSILDGLEHLHLECKMVYRDLKPENILLYSNFDKDKKVALCDFGLSSRFTNSQINRVGRFLHGTPRYASINCHLGKCVSYTDDLENLIYVIFYLHKGSLPWQAYESVSTTFLNNNILIAKQTISAYELTTNSILANIYDYIVRVNSDRNLYIKTNANPEELKKFYFNIRNLLNVLDEKVLSSSIINETPQEVPIRPVNRFRKFLKTAKKFLCCGQ
ncbi:KC1 [Hepatospora eriocheir]|uniref:non-specific serine/threonine protein kinase n=1 Tax=Hepatospora eriocheir TaxID=1081669 RepID=A0A1X0QBR5_9MICR|nr:KC1 [Hepatospora eriocheir]ORD99195.1 KC1 [Hepatospora eriocheir]